MDFIIIFLVRGPKSLFSMYIYMYDIHENRFWNNHAYMYYINIKYHKNNMWGHMHFSVYIPIYSLTICTKEACYLYVVCCLDIKQILLNFYFQPKNVRKENYFVLLLNGFSTISIIHTNIYVVYFVDIKNVYHISHTIHIVTHQSL